MNTVIFFDYTSKATKKRYEGKFSVNLYLTKREVLRADEFRRIALGADSANAAPAFQTDAYVAGQLYVMVQDGPSWWKESSSGLDLPNEDNVALALYEEILKAKEEISKTDAKTADKMATELKGAQID